MKNNSFNNILSFLITSILIFMLAFIFMTFAIESYQNSVQKVDEIQKLQEQKEKEIQEIIENMHP